jgi:hypothetical protein
LLGWRSDEEEFLIFPDLDSYANYRAGIGLAPQNLTTLRSNQVPFYTDEFGNRILGTRRNRDDDEDFTTVAAGNLGDVVNGRAITIMPLSAIPQRYLGNSRQRTRILLSPNYLVSIGSLHARALIDALARGGTAVPPWMYNGLAAFSERESNTWPAAVCVATTTDPMLMGRRCA